MDDSWWMDPLEPEEDEAPDVQEDTLFDVRPFANGFHGDQSTKLSNYGVKLRNLPRPRDVVRAQQTCLFGGTEDTKIYSTAQSRTFCGDFYEEASAMLLGLDYFQRLVTDSRAVICPDMRSLGGDHAFIECKSIGQHRQGLLYDHKVEAYDTLLATWFPSLSDPDPVFTPKLMYVIWFHDVKTTGYTSLNELRAALASKTRACFIVGYETMKALAKKCTRAHFTHVNSGDGGEGYRLSVKKFHLIREDPKALADEIGVDIHSTRFWSNPLTVYGLAVDPTPVYVALDAPINPFQRRMLARLRAKRMYADPNRRKPCRTRKTKVSKSAGARRARKRRRSRATPSA